MKNQLPKMSFCELLGTVTFVLKSTEISDGHLQVYTSGSKRTYTLLNRFPLPIEEGDSIYAVCSYEKQDSGKLPDKMTIAKFPLVQIPKDKESITKFMFKAVQKKALLVMSDLENEKNIFNFLTEKSLLLVRDNICCKTITSLDDKQTRELLYLWYDIKVLRQIYLLGITKEEFEDYRLKKDFYSQCLENPYCIYTIPMEKAERIAGILNLKLKDNDKLCGAVVRKIYDFVKKKNYVGAKMDFMKKTFDLNEEILAKLENEYDVVIQYDTMYLKYYFSVETVISEKLTIEQVDFPELPDLDSLKLLSTDQLEAIKFALNNRVSIITGSAGTGKTTLIKELCKILKFLSFNFIIMAFPGKAVARIKDITGLEEQAMTVHRAICKGYYPEIVILDEISMVSNNLLYEYLSLSEFRKLILIGDPNQLPPIDWGDLTKQLINKIPRFILTSQHRQDSKDLLDILNTVLKGEYLETETTENFSIINGGYEKVLEVLSNLRKDNISIYDTTVISPLNADVTILNPKIQKLYDDGYETLKDYSREFKVLDKVMMTDNNERYEIYNGDEGRIIEINSEENKVVVKFRDKLIPFFLGIKKTKFGKLSADFLIHSFCITVHKSQGSEWNHVVIYLKNFTSFISNNLLYTALSRAKKKIYVIGTLDIMNKAIQNNIEDRHDNIAKRIK